MYASMRQDWQVAHIVKIFLTLFGIQGLINAITRTQNWSQNLATICSFTSCFFEMRFNIIWVLQWTCSFQVLRKNFFLSTFHISSMRVACPSCYVRTNDIQWSVSKIRGPWNGLQQIFEWEQWNFGHTGRWDVTRFRLNVAVTRLVKQSCDRPGGAQRVPGS